MKKSGAIFVVCLILLIIFFIMFVRLNTSFFFPENEYSPIKLFYTENGSIKKEINFSMGGKISKGFDVKEKYPIKEIRLKITNPLIESQGELKIVFENSSIGDYLWDEIDGEFSLNNSRVFEYRDDNGPDFILVSDLFYEGYVPIDAPFWASQPPLEGKFNPLFKRISYDTFEAKYYLDNSFTGEKIGNELAYSSEGDYLIKLQILIPEGYRIEEAGGSTLKQSLGYTQLDKDLPKGEVLKITIVDKRLERKKEFLNLLLTIIMIPMLIEILASFRKSQQT